MSAGDKLARRVQIPTLTPEKRRNAALYMESIALDLPEEEREDALSEVLEALGYKVKKPAERTEHYVDVYGRLDRSYMTRKNVRTTKSASAPVETQVVSAPKTRVCGPDRGTIKGYRRHISAYNTACPECAAARQLELNERWDQLGIASHARGRVSKW